MHNTSGRKQGCHIMQSMMLKPRCDHECAALRTGALATFVANKLPSMLPKLIVSCIAPNARPRCSGLYRSAIKLCAQGITNARPRPFMLVNAPACQRVPDMETPMVHRDQMRAPDAIMVVRS